MKLKLIDKKTETENVQSFIFEPEEKIIWEPGQYMHYVLQYPNPDDRGEERWFTISAAPFEEKIAITTRFAPEKGSTFKQRLAQLSKGDTVEADGPEGDFVLRKGNFKHVLIAGGIGITPFRSMLLQQDHDQQQIKADLLYLNRDDNFVFGPALEKLSDNHPDFRFLRFVNKKIIKADLTDYLKENNAVYYLSGPEAMVEAYEGLLESLKVDKANIITDYFPGY